MYLQVNMLSKQELKEHILTYIQVGTDVNTDRSTFRIVKSISDEAMIIPKGVNAKMTVTWEMLYKCYQHLFDQDGYSVSVFRSYYPKICDQAGCFVNTIGQIFVLAGLATVNLEKKPFIYKTTEK